MNKRAQALERLRQIEADMSPQDQEWSRRIWAELPPQNAARTRCILRVLATELEVERYEEVIWDVVAGAPLDEALSVEEWVQVRRKLSDLCKPAQ